MDELTQTIRGRYLQAQEKIARAALSVGRSPSDVRLVTVTKTQPLSVVRAAVEAGAVLLGENYPEEGVMKIQSLTAPSHVQWHMIGHVQSRKAALVARHFDFLHSLDSLKLAQRLNRFCGEIGRRLPVLLEFNVGGEESKSGWNAADESRWAALLDDVGAVLALPNLDARGLMTMPPLGEVASRLYFQKLRRLRDYLCGQFPHFDFRELSMGTSADYETAVQEGATFVRLGTTIVGARQYKTEAE
ncbi:MAG: YggS family pyridoxal phosphate-dependent enzyme [Anaerolineales bacterium]